MNIRQAVALLQEKGYTVSGGKLPEIKITRKVVGRIKKMMEKHRQVVVVRKQEKVTVFSFDGYRNRVAAGKKGGAARWHSTKEVVKS